MNRKTTRAEAERRYKEAHELAEKLQRLVDEQAPGWTRLEEALALATKEERLWLGRLIDPVENGDLEEANGDLEEANGDLEEANGDLEEAEKREGLH